MVGVPPSRPPSSSSSPLIVEKVNIKPPRINFFKKPMGSSSLLFSPPPRMEKRSKDNLFFSSLFFPLLFPSFSLLSPFLYKRDHVKDHYQAHRSAVAVVSFSPSLVFFPPILPPPPYSDQACKTLIQTTRQGQGQPPSLCLPPSPFFVV